MTANDNRSVYLEEQLNKANEAIKCLVEAEQARNKLVNERLDTLSKEHEK